MRCGDRYIARTMRQPLNRSLACRHVVCGCSTSRIEAVCRHSTQKEYVSIIIVLETGFPLWPPQSSSARGLRQPLASTYSLRDLNFNLYFFVCLRLFFLFLKAAQPKRPKLRRCQLPRRDGVRLHRSLRSAPFSQPNPLSPGLRFIVINVNRDPVLLVIFWGPLYPWQPQGVYLRGREEQPSSRVVVQGIRPRMQCRAS